MSARTGVFDANGDGGDEAGFVSGPAQGCGVEFMSVEASGASPPASKSKKKHKSKTKVNTPPDAISRSSSSSSSCSRGSSTAGEEHDAGAWVQAAVVGATSEMKNLPRGEIDAIKAVESETNVGGSPARAVGSATHADAGMPIADESTATHGYMGITDSMAAAAASGDLYVPPYDDVAVVQPHAGGMG